MKLRWLLYVLAVPLPSMLSWAKESPSEPAVQILTIGTSFHGDEVKAKTGEKWLGLYARGDEYFLIPVTLKVEAAYDALLDFNQKDPKDQSKKTGKSVEAIVDEDENKENDGTTGESSRRLVLLIKGGGLTPGKVDSAFPPEKIDTPSRKPGSFAPRSGIYMKLGAMDYRLSLELRWPSKYTPVVEPCALYLSQGNMRQRIARQPASDDDWEKGFLTEERLGCFVGDGFPTLAWAGDLDRDGKLDLILDPRYHYNVGATTLFLSSMAKDGELLGLAARFIATGC